MTNEQGEPKKGRKIRVVFGLGSLGPGGMERQFVEQTRFFNREKYDVILVTLFEHPGAPNLYGELPHDLSVHRFDFKGWVDMFSWYRLHRLLKELRPDIVVSSLFFANTAFRVLRWFIGYRVIAREHNTYIDKGIIARLIDRVLANSSNCIVAVSTKVANFTAAQEHIPRNRFVIIHNGIDIDHVAAQISCQPAVAEIRTELGLGVHERILLNVARLVPQKDHRLLIDGFAQFHESHPEWTLFIVGGGSLQKELEDLSRKLGVGNAVRFFGHRDDIWKFYKVAEGLVSSSQIEGLSNTYLEAFAAGLPVVATKTAGTDELIRENQNGYFIQERTAESVNVALETLHRADRASMSEACRETARRCDIRETVRSYEKLFSSIIT